MPCRHAGGCAPSTSAGSATRFDIRERVAAICVATRRGKRGNPVLFGVPLLCRDVRRRGGRGSPASHRSARRSRAGGGDAGRRGAARHRLTERLAGIIGLGEAGGGRRRGGGDTKTVAELPYHAAIMSAAHRASGGRGRLDAPDASADGGQPASAAIGSPSTSGGGGPGGGDRVSENRPGGPRLRALRGGRPRSSWKRERARRSPILRARVGPRAPHARARWARRPRGRGRRPRCSFPCAPHPRPPRLRAAPVPGPARSARRRLTSRTAAGSPKCWRAEA